MSHVPLVPVGFDVHEHVCDRCDRVVFDGLVVMSNGMKVGRDCAATLLGRKKSDKALKDLIEGLEVRALKQRYAENRDGAVQVLSLNVLGLRRGAAERPTTPYWFDGYFTWSVEAWPDGSLVARMDSAPAVGVLTDTLKDVLGEENVVPFMFTQASSFVGLPHFVEVKKFWKSPPRYAMSSTGSYYRVSDLPRLARLVAEYRA